MAGNKNFKGKNPYTDRRKMKLDEIKQSLIHKARLRKNYHKMLAKEGIKHDDERIDTNEQGSNDETEQRSEDEENVDVPKAKYQQDHKSKAKAPINYAERAKYVKQKKEERRKEKLQLIRRQKELMELKERERQLKKKKLSSKTKTGQPLMGPRINNLLEKIKKDMK